MKTKPTSGNKAAIPNTQPSSPSAKTNPHRAKGQLQFGFLPTPPEYIEPLVTKETLRDHYGISIRTINYAMTLGLPKVPVGKHVRFRMSEVQPWFEQNGYRRFAAEGIKMAVTKALLKQKQFQFALSGSVKVTTESPKLKRKIKTLKQ